MHQQLHLAYFDSRPDMSRFDIKEMVAREFFGVDFTFRVIGDSHYIEAPEIGYYELFSCKPIENDAAVRVELTVGEQQSVRHETDDVRVEANIVGQSLHEFPKYDDFDVKHRFGRNAFTTIKCVSEETYSTYHTYPEYNLALYTENTLTTTQANTPQNTPENTLII